MQKTDLIYVSSTRCSIESRISFLKNIDRPHRPKKNHEKKGAGAG
jgi:hypothetical protein